MTRFFNMKNKTRERLLENRKKMSKNDVLEKSELIKKRFFALQEFKEAENIAFYVSYDNEVYTHDMIKESMAKKKNVFVPYVDKKNRDLILSKLKNWGDLQVGAYNVLEPKKECIQEAFVENVDIVVVPGVGFDVKGNRIGHGRGYYDRFLNGSTAERVGLAFEFQIVDRIPVDDHDEPVDKIITERRTIDCSKEKSLGHNFF